MTNPDLTECSKCTKSFENPSIDTNMWELDCQHALCPRCFTKFVGDVKKECPVCNKTPRSIVHSFYEIGTATRTREAALIEMTDIIYLSSNEVPYITMSLPGKPPSTISLEVNGGSPDTECFLEHLFSKLSPILLPFQKSTYTREAHKLDTDDVIGESYDEKLSSIVTEDKTLLKKLLTKLAFGEARPNDSSSDAQLFLAAENIRRAKEGRGSMYRRIMTNAFSILGPEARNKILRNFGVCYSRQTEERNDRKRADAVRLNFKKITLDRNSFAILLFDNLGFKNRQGFRKGLGYEQFTVLKIIVISPDQLRDIKIYEKEGEEVLSRVRKEWADTRDTDEGNFDDIAAPRDEDCNLLASTVYDIVGALLKAEKDGKFPSLSTAKKLLAKDAFRNGRKPTILFCPEYSGREDRSAGVQDDSDDTHGVTDLDHDKLKTEQVIFDVPMKKDLNKTDTVIDIMEYACDIVISILAGDDIDDNFTRLEPILSDARIVIAGDGSPIISAQNYMRGDEDMKQQLLAVFGGFHLMLEIYKKRGALFEHTHLRNIFAMTRESSKAQDHVLFPSDPNQTEAETFQMHAGIHLSAIRTLIQLKREGRNIIESLDRDLKEWEDDALDSEEESEDDEDSDTSSRDENIEDDSEDDIENDSDKYIDEDSDDDIDSDEDNEDKNTSSREDDSTNADENDKTRESRGREENERESLSADSSEESSSEDSIQHLLDEVDITPKDVVDFMIERARRNPQAFIVLLDMRFAELVFMLQRSESRADPALYCAALRYAMLLCVNTNASKYVEMMTNFCIDRACMSDAERAILDTFVLFRRTKNLKTIFSDRNVEWTMRDIRIRLGKYYKESTDGALTRIVTQMQDSLQKQGRSKVSESAPSKKSAIKIDASLLEVYVWCESANLWRGRPMSVKAKPYKKRLMRRLDDKEQLEALPSPKQLYTTTGAPLYGDVLSVISRGLSKAEQYFQVHHVDGELTKKSRSRKESNLQLPKIDTEGLKIEIELAICLKEDVIQKSRVYTALRVDQELALINEELNDLDLDSFIPEGKSKLDHVRALIQARKKLKGLDIENWEEKTVFKITHRYEGVQTSALDTISAELDGNSFFTFAGTASSTNAEIGGKAITFTFSGDEDNDLCEDERVKQNAKYNAEKEVLWNDAIEYLNQRGLDD